MNPTPSTEALRLLVIADDDAAARLVVERLDKSLAPGVRISMGKVRAAADAAESRAEVVLLAAGALDRIEADALAIRTTATQAAPILLALCTAADRARAGDLCVQGAFDDYAPHPPVPGDPRRLSVSLAVAARIALARRPAAPPRKRPLVLVVEDDDFAQQMVAMTLESADVEVVAEHDGAAALERIRAVRPDLVLMDVMLPSRDGVELTGHLKADPELAGIHVIMLTGEARREVLVRSMEAGASDFIVKPFTPDALLAKVWKFLPRRG